MYELFTMGGLGIAGIIAICLAYRLGEMYNENADLRSALAETEKASNRYSNLYGWYTERCHTMKNFIIEHKMWKDFEAYDMAPPIEYFDDPEIVVPMTDPRKADAETEPAVMVGEVLPPLSK